MEKAQQSYGGGKGANQAIATARMKANTTFISKVGKDGLAQFMFDDFKDAGMNIDYILESETESTGQAFITVDAQGQNTIYVYGGANMAITPEDVVSAKEAITQADFIVAQLEVPVPAIIGNFQSSKSSRCNDSLKSSTSQGITTRIMELIDVIVPNEFGSRNIIRHSCHRWKRLWHKMRLFLRIRCKSGHHYFRRTRYILCR